MLMYAYMGNLRNAKAFYCLFNEVLPFPVRLMRAKFRSSGQAQGHRNDVSLFCAPNALKRPGCEAKETTTMSQSGLGDHLALRNILSGREGRRVTPAGIPLRLSGCFHGDPAGIPVLGCPHIDSQ